MKHFRVGKDISHQIDLIGSGRFVAADVGVGLVLVLLSNHHHLNLRKENTFSSRSIKFLDERKINIKTTSSCFVCFFVFSFFFLSCLLLSFSEPGGLGLSTQQPLTHLPPVYSTSKRLTVISYVPPCHSFSPIQQFVYYNFSLFAHQSRDVHSLTLVLKVFSHLAESNTISTVVLNSQSSAHQQPLTPETSVHALNSRRGDSQI